MATSVGCNSLLPKFTPGVLSGFEPESNSHANPGYSTFSKG